MRKLIVKKIDFYIDLSMIGFYISFTHSCIRGRFSGTLKRYYYSPIGKRIVYGRPLWEGIEINKKPTMKKSIKIVKKYIHLNKDYYEKNHIDFINIPNLAGQNTSE